MSAANEELPAARPEAVVTPVGRRRRRWGLWVMAVVVALAGGGVAVAVVKPFASAGGGPAGVVDNADPTSLATVTRQDLSSQTEVPATLGYARSSSVLLPGGTAPGTLTQDKEKVAADQDALGATATKNQSALEQAQGQVATAEQSLSADQAAMAVDQRYASSDGQTSTYTALPAVGQVIVEGRSLFAVNGQDVPSCTAT